MDPRPGRIRQVVEAPLAKPRHRAEPAFAQVRQPVLDLLNDPQL